MGPWFEPGPGSQTPGVPVLALLAGIFLFGSTRFLAIEVTTQALKRFAYIVEVRQAAFN